MKNLYLLFCFLCVATLVSAQDGITVCHTSSTEKFALFASNKDFNAQHPRPGSYIHISQEGGKMISFKTPDGQDAKGYFIEAKQTTRNWIFVFQEWWGLNEYIKKQTEILYKDLGNVNVIALDMYDGKVTADRQTASGYMQQFKQERGDAIVKGALEFAGKDTKVGTVGWCFGGGQSLIASITVGKQAAGGVIYYGMPVDDIEQLKKLNCDILGIFASREKYITPEIVKKFEENMKLAGKKLTVKNYDAEHGFANPSNAIFDKTAAEDAWKHTTLFFKEKLK
jgi:carboxymethylenebutenolidase